MLLEVFTIAFSAVAVAVSIFAVLRQSRLATASKDLSFTVQALIENLREKEFQDDQRYVLDELADAYPAGTEYGIDNLPTRARQAAWHVVFMYESIGLAYALEMVDRRIVLTMFNYRLRETWQALECYIVNERRRRGAPFVPFFENMYNDATRTDPITIYRSLRLDATYSAPDIDDVAGAAE